MKTQTILLSLLLIFPPVAVAQPQTLSAERNTPRGGDGLVKEQYPWCEPGKAGENQTWDFSRLKAVNEDYKVDYFTRGDIEMLGAENGLMLSHFFAKGDSLLQTGYESPNVLIYYHQPGLFLHFPLAYGSSTESSFAGRGKYHDLLESTVAGKIQTVADATGILILPEGDEMKEVIRVHIRKTEVSRYIPVSPDFTIAIPADKSLFSNSEPEEVITDTYHWYADGYRYPVFETVEKYRNGVTEKITLSRTAYLYHPAGQQDLPDDNANREALERKEAERKASMTIKESNILSFRCSPNPVKELLEIDLVFKKEEKAEIGIWDMQGRLTVLIPSKTTRNTYREAVNMAAFPQGYYMVKAFTANETVSETILKQ